MKTKSRQLDSNSFRSNIHKADMTPAIHMENCVYNSSICIGKSGEVDSGSGSGSGISTIYRSLSGEGFLLA